MTDILIFLLGLFGGAFLMAVVNGNAYERGCNDTWDWIGEYLEEKMKKNEPEADDVDWYINEDREDPE